MLGTCRTWLNEMFDGLTTPKPPESVSAARGSGPCSRIGRTLLEHGWMSSVPSPPCTAKAATAPPESSYDRAGKGLSESGREGWEDEESALERELAIIGFREIPSLEGARDYDAVFDRGASIRRRSLVRSGTARGSYGPSPC